MKLCRAVERPITSSMVRICATGKPAAGHAQLLGDGGNGLVGVAVGAHQPEERLNIGVGRGIAVRDLGNGNHHHGVGWLAEAAVVGVGDDADDLALGSPPVPAYPVPVHDVLADGVFVGPELSGQGLIDESHTGRAGLVVSQ